ncbi:hypothetical protein FRC17_005171 [Serendipita sp. 399]|nr:hypothetical protein FRC17_005171 [Serendipita sp. 399]
MDKNPVTRTLIRRIKATYSVDQLETDSPDILEEMLAIFETYVRELEIICSARSVVPSRPLLEEEIVAGSIVASCSQYRRADSRIQKLRKANIAAMRRESIDLCIMIKDAIRGVHLDEDEQSEKNTLRRAWNAWKVSVACEDSFGGKSFGLLACNIIFAVLG